MEKTNVQHLEEILSELQTKEMGEDYRNTKFEEATEFLDAIKDELEEKNNEISDFKEEVEAYEEKEKEYEKMELTNSDFVGLDTLNWSLENGNLKIESRVEQFIQQLKEENSVVPV